MRHNGSRPLLASDLPPNTIALYAGERPSVACPTCGRWRLLRRGMLAPHRAADGGSRCPGSAQRVVIDLSPALWHTRLRAAELEAAQHRPARAHPRPAPPTPPPVCRIHAA